MAAPRRGARNFQKWVPKRKRRARRLGAGCPKFQPEISVLSPFREKKRASKMGSRNGVMKKSCREPDEPEPSRTGTGLNREPAEPGPSRTGNPRMEPEAS